MIIPTGLPGGALITIIPRWEPGLEGDWLLVFCFPGGRLIVRLRGEPAHVVDDGPDGRSRSPLVRSSGSD